MEFSATLPIDLDALAAAWSRPLEAAAGPDPPIQSESGLAPGEAPLETEFAETLESTLTAGGEVLPLAGSLLPLPIVLEGQASAVAPPAPPGSSAGAARPDARPAVLEIGRAHV